MNESPALFVPSSKKLALPMPTRERWQPLRLGLVEASSNKIGTPVDNILTYCYHYDPQTNKHSLMVARVVQVGGMITVAGLGGFMFLMFRRDVNGAREHDLTKKETDKG